MSLARRRRRLSGRGRRPRDGQLLCRGNGERLWQERLGSHFSASLVTAGGLVYLIADDGANKNRPARSQVEVVAENPLGEHCYSSPAISHGCIFIRGEKHLYCFGKL